MTPLIVVDDLEDWPAAAADPPVIDARRYLDDPAYGEPGAWRVVNLCQVRHYQNPGYYVSLLAEARNHRPLPAPDAVLNLQSDDLIRLALTGLEPLVQHALSDEGEPYAKLRICFGKGSRSAHHDQLCRRIYERLPAPLLAARFAQRNGAWRLRSLRPLSLRNVSARQRWQVAQAARAHCAHCARSHQGNGAMPLRLAILRDPDNHHPASNDAAIQRFQAAANEQGIETEIIGRHDGPRLSAFDGLFIRDNTFMRHYSYRLACHAAALGLAVIDDPVSILRCNNKVYVTELLARHHAPTPRTLVVDRRGLDSVIPTLGLPCVLKQPDSCLSLGVGKAETPAQFAALSETLFRNSDLILAQQYLPTAFDWRVGILDRRPLFVCRYHMVPGHWQIVRHEEEGGRYEEGITEALPLHQAPPALLRLGLKAANLIGDGFYGVDVKQAGRRYYVIEINDNPNVDAGNEDGALGDELYRRVMASFARRMTARKGLAP